jgi:hypothetical protein
MERPGCRVALLWKERLAGAEPREGESDGSHRGAEPVRGGALGLGGGGGGYGGRGPVRGVLAGVGSGGRGHVDGGVLGRMDCTTAPRAGT